MGDVGSDLFTTAGARTAYTTGLRVFGRTYLQGAMLTPDQLWGNIRGSVAPLQSLLSTDRVTNPDGYAPATTDARAEFATEAGALSDPDLARRDPAAFVTACAQLSDLLDGVDRAVTDQLARPRGAPPAGQLTAGESALATSAALCEGIRGVLGMKRSSSQAPRSQQELDTALQSRDDLARMAETSERQKDADPNYNRRDPSGRR